MLTVPFTFSSMLWIAFARKEPADSSAADTWSLSEASGGLKPKVQHKPPETWDHYLHIESSYDAYCLIFKISLKKNKHLHTIPTYGGMESGSTLFCDGGESLLSVFTLGEEVHAERGNCVEKQQQTKIEMMGYRVGGYRVGWWTRTLTLGSGGVNWAGATLQVEGERRTRLLIICSQPPSRRWIDSECSEAARLLCAPLLATKKAWSEKCETTT